MDFHSAPFCKFSRCVYPYRAREHYILASFVFFVKLTRLFFRHSKSALKIEHASDAACEHVLEDGSLHVLLSAEGHICIHGHLLSYRAYSLK
jgi:hypothetical protein